MAIKDQGYNDFSASLKQLTVGRRIPARAIFELTYRCNFRCLHCYNSRKGRRNELKTEEVFEILRQLVGMGCFFIGFTGGEIFMRSDIFDIISFARKQGLQVILLTNASLIDRAKADRLKDLALNKVDITVHAVDKGVFDRVTRAPGSAVKVFRAIELLRQRGIPLGIKSCGLKENKEEVLKVASFAEKINAPYRFSSELLPRQDGSRQPLRHGMAPEESLVLSRQCYPQRFKAQDLKKKEGKLRRIFNCGAGYTDLAVNPFGELNICIEIDRPRYNILRGNLAFGWDKVKKIVDSCKPARDWACRSCSLIPYCSWCPGKGYLEDGRFTTCDAHSRSMAQVAKRFYESHRH